MQISVQIVVQTEVDEQANITEIVPVSSEKASRPARSACSLMRQRRCQAGCSIR